MSSEKQSTPKQRKINLFSISDDDDDTEQFSQVFPGPVSDSEIYTPKKAKKTDTPRRNILNFAPDESAVKNSKNDPLEIYIGKTVYLELKKFRSEMYVGLYKRETPTSEIRNRFNVPVSQLANLKKALAAIENQLNF